MNEHTDFTGMASAAAAMNADTDAATRNVNARIAEFNAFEKSLAGVDPLQHAELRLRFYAPIPDIQPHWSDDPRFDSKQHYDDVMAGRATLDNTSDEDANPWPLDPSAGGSDGNYDWHVRRGE